MSKTVRIKISHSDENFEVDVSKYLGSENFKIKYLLAKHFSKPIAKMIGSVNGSKSIQEALTSNIDFGSIAEALVTVFDSIGDEDQALGLFKRINSKVTIYHGKEIFYLSKDMDFDNFFIGRGELVYKIAIEVLKINFPFFERGLISMTEFFGKTEKTDMSVEQDPGKTPSTGQSDQSESSEKILKQNGLTGDSLINRVLEKQKQTI